MIELDGSYREGGGALVRVALALSALTGQEFNVINIRAGRKDPGLKAQHLEAIKALQQICQAKTNDIALGSTELQFTPGKIKSGTYEINIGTAGSITLLLQALILPCMVAPSKITLTITGGTCGKWQASVDYLQNVLLPHLRKFVEKIDLKILKRGYYPKGGGKVLLEIRPKFKKYAEMPGTVPLINLVEPGTLEQIRGVVNVSSELQEKKVAERISSAAQESLKKYAVPCTLRTEYAAAPSIGGDALLWAVFSTHGDIPDHNPVILGSDALVEPSKSSERIGKEAAEKLAIEIDSGAAVDHYVADQLIPFMALLPGSTINASAVSNHAQTNIYVVEKFLPVKFMVEGKSIRCVSGNDRRLK